MGFAGRSPWGVGNKEAHCVQRAHSGTALTEDGEARCGPQTRPLRTEHRECPPPARPASPLNGRDVITEDGLHLKRPPSISTALVHPHMPRGALQGLGLQCDRSG